METVTKTLVWVTVNLKGGSGKTSLAVHLSAVASSKEMKVCLIDTDPTESAKRWTELGEMGYECMRAEKRELSRSVLQGKGRYDLIVIDTPAVMADVALSALAEADAALIPMHTGSGDIDQVADTDHLLSMPRRVNPQMLVRVVMNHTGRIPTLDRDTRAVVEDYGLRVAKQDIPFLKEYASAKGRAVDPESAKHFRKLFEELYTEQVQQIQQGALT